LGVFGAFATFLLLLHDLKIIIELCNNIQMITIMGYFGGTPKSPSFRGILGMLREGPIWAILAFLAFFRQKVQKMRKKRMRKGGRLKTAVFWFLHQEVPKRAKKTVFLQKRPKMRVSPKWRFGGSGTSKTQLFGEYSLPPRGGSRCELVSGASSAADRPLCAAPCWSACPLRRARSARPLRRYASRRLALRAS